MGTVLSRLQFDWLLATIALGIAVMVYMGASFKDNEPKPAPKVAFKCTAVVYAGVGQVLTALYDNMTRTSWEPYVLSVSGNSHISVTYQTKYSKVTQDISRQFIKDDDVYYLIEKNGPELKYVFKIQAAESNYEERTSVILFGSTSDSDPTIGNPEALMSLKNLTELRALVSYSHASSIIINEEESSEEELKIREDTNLSLSSVPDERREMINGFSEEAKRVLKDAQELMEESEGWERLNLGIPGINAARRKASGGLYVIMSQGIINRTPDDILAYLEDISRKPEYDPMFESGRVVEKLPDDMEIAYQKYKKTGPVSARDFCLLQKRFVISDSYVAAVATSVNHPDVPDTQFVRAHLYMGCFMLEKIDQVRTKVTYMVHVDIKGSIPKFIVNKVQNGQGKVVHLLAENLKF